jgi:5-methyltetrahydrofolate--homocysteine methyltransferase
MDGAMGTELLRRYGSEFSDQYDADLVAPIHRDYLAAGAEVLLTNTFQVNPSALAKRNAGDQLHARWREAISLARGGPSEPYVLADVGPIERLTPDLAAQVLNECVDVDGVLLETWTSFDDLRRFADRPHLPLLVSFTFHRTSDLMTIHGASPEECARTAQRYGAVAVGANCGKEIGMADMLEIVRRYHAVCELPVFVRPNAGTPRSGLRYPRTPATMTAALVPLLEEGIAMIGGCCGTTPAHIERFRAVVDEFNAHAAWRGR